MLGDVGVQGQGRENLVRKLIVLAFRMTTNFGWVAVNSISHTNLSFAAVQDTELFFSLKSKWVFVFYALFAHMHRGSSLAQKYL